jgi:hypothetical protein
LSSCRLRCWFIVLISVGGWKILHAGRHKTCIQLLVSALLSSLKEGLQIHQMLRKSLAQMWLVDQLWLTYALFLSPCANIVAGAIWQGWSHDFCRAWMSSVTSTGRGFLQLVWDGWESRSYSGVKWLNPTFSSTISANYSGSKALMIALRRKFSTPW